MNISLEAMAAFKTAAMPVTAAFKCFLTTILGIPNRSEISAKSATLNASLGEKQMAIVSAAPFNAIV